MNPVVPQIQTYSDLQTELPAHPMTFHGYDFTMSSFQNYDLLLSLCARAWVQGIHGVTPLGTHQDLDGVVLSKYPLQ